MAAPDLRPAAFLDRDGVINVERGYVHRVEDFELLGGAIEGARLLHEAGYALVVITNQAGIARGLYTEAQYQVLTSHLQGLFSAQGLPLAGVYHCPHHPDARVAAYRRDCNCRKPAPGLLLQAARELGLDLARSVLVGDKASDIGAARAAGLARAVLVRSGHAVSAAEAAQADACLDDLTQAARWLLRSPTA